MPPLRGSGISRPLGNLFLSPKSPVQRLGWLVLVVAVVLELIGIVGNFLTDSFVHPLAPVGSGVVLVAVLAAGLRGARVGLAAALVGVAAAFLLLADFSTTAGAANAAVSAIIWCVAALTTGLVSSALREQVMRREAALAQSLSLSLSAREQMERVLEFTPTFHQEESLDDTAKTICQTAVETFGADGARFYSLGKQTVDLLAIHPAPENIGPGFFLPMDEFPDLDRMLGDHRPSFVRDIREARPTGPALQLQRETHSVSIIRIPIASPAGPIGLLVLGWTHVIERPADELLAIMQRFADQAAIAWQNALRLEAQKQADTLHDTLDRLVALAPTFHITGTTQEVAKAICEAAVATFDCSATALYRIEGDRIRVLDRVPSLEPLTRGRVFPLTADMPLTQEIRSGTSTFVEDAADPDNSISPWPRELILRAGVRSVLYVPVRFNERGPRNLLVLSWNRLRDKPDANFLVIVQRFADQAALALSNASAARLHARLEASLLPATPVEHPYLKVYTRYRTGEQRLRLGGDFVGSTPAGDRGLCFMIGDVSGHGPDAAALGATLRSTWKALALAGESTPKITRVMKQMLLAERGDPSVFATIVVGQIDLDTSSVSFVNAGHQPPILVADKVVSLDTAPACPLGVDKGNDWWESRFDLPARWSLFFCTDGLIEVRLAPGSQERYGEERLKARLAAWIGSTPDGSSLDTLVGEIEAASGSPFADDVALLLISTKNDESGS